MDAMTIAAIVAMGLAALADVYTTERFLKYGYVEKNPAVAWAMRRFGRGWILIKLTVTGFVTLLSVLSGVLWILWAGAIFTGVIALRNWKLVR